MGRAGICIIRRGSDPRARSTTRIAAAKTGTPTRNAGRSADEGPALVGERDPRQECGRPPLHGEDHDPNPGLVRDSEPPGADSLGRATRRPSRRPGRARAAAARSPIRTMGARSRRRHRRSSSSSRCRRPPRRRDALDLRGDCGRDRVEHETEPPMPQESARHHAILVPRERSSRYPDPPVTVVDSTGYLT